MQKLPALEKRNSSKKSGDAMRVKRGETIPFCGEIELGFHKLEVDFTGGYFDTYIDEFHFIVEEIKGICLVRKGKKRELKLTNDFERKIICELERLAN